MTDIILQRSTMTETPQGRFVEMAFAETADIESAPEMVLFRFRVEDSGQYPRLVQCEAEALRKLRELITAEIQRTQRAAGR